jgi:hypothetical protein
MAIVGSPFVQVLLWLVAVAATVWILAPTVLRAMGRGRYWMTVSDDPHDAEPDGRDRQYESWFRQYAGLGFRPVGKTVEQMKFMSPLHWSRTSKGARTLASADGRTFAICFRFENGMPLRTAIDTIFEEGGLLTTASPGVPMTIETGPNDRYQPVGDVGPEELLRIHAARVESFVQERGLTVKKATLRDLAAEEERRTRVMFSKTKGQSWSVLAVFAIPAVIALQSGRGLARPYVPALICVAAAIFALIRWVAIPGRIPMFARMAVLFGVVLLPSMLLPIWMSPERTVDRALDRLEASATLVDPSQAADKIARSGSRGCGALLRRLDNPATKPETRTIIHGALVKLNGSDLGDAPDAWRDWCVTVRQGR